MDVECIGISVVQDEVCKLSVGQRIFVDSIQHIQDYDLIKIKTVHVIHLPSLK